MTASTIRRQLTVARPAFLLTRAMTSMLVGVQPTDAVTYAAILVLFLIIAVAACLIPARRAASLDPTAALRSE
jgi:putative ABC transport system permease protein